MYSRLETVRCAPKKPQSLTACDPAYGGALQRLENGEAGVALGKGERGGAANNIGKLGQQLSPS